MWRVTESVSVATYNLYLGADLSLLLGERPRDELATNLAEVERQLFATAFPQRATHIARSLAEREVDLVGLQEVCCWTVSERQVWDFAALLLGSLREHGVEYEAVSEVATFSGEGELPNGGTGLPIHVRGSNVVLRRVGSPVTVTDEGHGLFDEALQVYSFGTPHRGHRARVVRGALRGRRQVLRLHRHPHRGLRPGVAQPAARRADGRLRPVGRPAGAGR